MTRRNMAMGGSTLLLILAATFAPAAVPSDALRLPLGAQVISVPWGPGAALVDDYAETTSQWTVSLGRTTELAHKDSATRPFTLRGTDWQTVEVNLGRRGEHFASWLSIATETPGNTVAIRQIRVVRPSEHAYFRTEIALPAAPLFGAIWYTAQPQFVIGVNGQEVHRGHGNGCGWWPASVEITKSLRSGKNVLSFDCELIDWMGRENSLIVGGVVRCADGHIVRIASDDSWRVGRVAEQGWTTPGFDASRWSRARSYGDAANAEFPHEVAAASGISTMWRASLEVGYQVIPPRHLGALTMEYPGRPDPLFGVDEPAVVNLSAPLRRFDGRRYGLAYRLYDSASRRLVAAGRMPPLPDDAVWSKKCDEHENQAACRVATTGVMEIPPTPRWGATDGGLEYRTARSVSGPRDLSVWLSPSTADVARAKEEFDLHRLVSAPLSSDGGIRHVAVRSPSQTVSRK